MFKIATLNKISPVGLAKFTDNYEIIDNLDDTTDAMDRIFGDALVALEQLTINKNDKGNNI